MSEVDRLIDEVLRLDESATKGPWEIPHGNLNGRIWCIGPIAGYDFNALEMRHGDVDATLVASYRSSAPRLARMLRVALDGLDRTSTSIGHEVLAEIEKIAKGEA